MTYRGHSVLRTLIRCHFSPDETTGSQYAYLPGELQNVMLTNIQIHLLRLRGRQDTRDSIPLFYVSN